MGTGSGDAVMGPVGPGVAAPGVAPTTDPLADLMRRATAIGLPLTEADARPVVAGVARLAAMAAEVRALLTPDIEPSGPVVEPWREVVP